VPKYLFKIHHQTQMTRQVTGYMARMLDNWGPGKTELGLSKDCTIESDHELPPDQLELIRHELLAACRKSDMDVHQVEYVGPVQGPEVTGGS